MSVVCLKSSLEESIHNGEHKEAALTFPEPPEPQSQTSSKVVSTDELALLAKLEEANRSAFYFIRIAWRAHILCVLFFFFLDCVTLVWTLVCGWLEKSITRLRERRYTVLYLIELIAACKIIYIKFLHVVSYVENWILCTKVLIILTA